MALAFPLTSMAGEMALDLQFDEDGKATPVTTYAEDWNENLFSRVKYRSLSITESGTVKSLKNSADTLNEQFVQLSLIGYQQKTDSLDWAVSGGVELIRIESSSFAFGPFPTETLAIENNIEITSTRALISAEVGYSTDIFYIKGGIDLKPAGSLSVKQDTSIEHGSNEFSGGSDDSHSTDLAYGLKVDGMLKTNLGFDVGFGVEYDLLPLKYDYQQATFDNAGIASGFESASLDSEEKTTRYSVRFILGHKTDMGRPMIGMTQETLTQEADGESSEETINYLVLGFDRRF